MTGNNIQYNPAEMFQEWIQKGGKAQAEFMRNFASMIAPQQNFDPLETLKEITDKASETQSNFMNNLSSMQTKGMNKMFNISQMMPNFLQWGAYKTSVGSNGRISIPEAEREALGLKEGDLVQVIVLPIEKNQRGGESMSTQQPRDNQKDVFGVSQQNVDKYFNGIKQSVPRYHQSVTNVQQEYLEAWENVINSTIALQKEYATKAGVNTNVPSAALKAIRDTTEEVVKAYDVQNKVALASIDAAQQNIKTFNDNYKAFADLNKNILQSWISTFAPKNN